MIDTIQRSVDDELAAFSGHERGVALSLLAWLGLRYYSKIYTNRALDIDLLQRIVGEREPERQMFILFLLFSELHSTSFISRARKTPFS